MNFVTRRKPIEVFGRSVAWSATAFVVAIIIFSPSLALASGASPPRVVNVTSDSETGWVPSEDLERQARATAIDYMTKMDSGKYADAYALLAELDQTNQPFSDFAKRVGDFNTRAGAVIERRIVAITWIKNPVNAPLPGVYAALDLVNRFANADRDCGYLILYQAPSGGPFRVMREENNFLDNVTAAKSTPAQAANLWAKLSAYCPGYQAAVRQPAESAMVVPPPITEASQSTIEYPSVDAALAALHSKPGVTFTNENGWTIAEDGAAQTIWSFAPPGYPAYPAVVKRQVLEHEGNVGIQMGVRCEATKQACDDLVRSFEQLNAQMRSNMQGHQ